jgi:hypothetical protein
MTRRLSILATLLMLGATAVVQAQAAELVDVYKSPYCGCCGKWVAHMEKNGFKVNIHEVSDVPGARKKLGIPDKLGSCHTSKVGNYVVEGHVPAADIKRLLKEQPKALGLAVPSMPPGSPGMDVPNSPPYETLLVQADGSTRVFARH